MCDYFELGPVVQEKMSFKEIPILVLLEILLSRAKQFV